MFGEIKNKEGETLDYTFHQGREESRDIVVIGHGVTGNKDRPFVVALATGLAAAGINALRFSFAGNGESGGHFVDSTVSKEIADLGSVLDVLAGYRIVFVGHSMGGAVGVSRASSDKRITRLVSLAGMVHTADFAAREFGEVTPDKGDMWDDEDCPLSQKYMDDMKQIHSVVEHATAIDMPWLLLHGTEDDVVPLQDSKDIVAKAGDGAKLIVLDGADHVFSEHADDMVKKLVGWIKAQLAQ